MKSAFRRSLLALSLVTFAACPGGGDKEPALADAPAAIAAAYCEAAPRCDADFHHVFDGVDCQATFESLVANRLLPTWQAGVTAGTLRFDAAALRTCLDSMADSCDAFQVGAFVPCLGVAFVGAVAPGGACTGDEECAGDARCELFEECPGVCVTNFSEGQACEGTRTCAEGLVCSNPDSKCHAPTPIGSPCDPDAYQLPECEAGSICVDDGSPVCEALVDLLVGEAGEACGAGPHQLCKPGLVCTFSPDPENGVCQPPLAVGATCNPFGFPDPCGEGHYCKIDENSSDGACAAMPADGERCRDRDQYDMPCATGFVCGGPESTCVPGKDIGEACSGDGECFSRTCLEGTCGVQICEVGG